MDNLYNPEYDAQVLADAEVIKASPGRVEAASNAARELAKNAEIRAAALRGIIKPVYDKMREPSKVVDNPDPFAGTSMRRRKK